MGATGSITAKVNPGPLFKVFTTWDVMEIDEMRKRCEFEYPETFGFRRHEFDFILGRDRLVDEGVLKKIFENVFDTDNNKLVDKFEVMSVICLASRLSNEDKVRFLFDILNFNQKGYLVESEVSLLLISVTNGVYKADRSCKVPTPAALKLLLDTAMTFAVETPGRLRKPELVKFASETKDVIMFLDAWRGTGSQVLLAKKAKWRDLLFPACKTSITPTDKWLKKGFPPDTFVRWRRRKNIKASSIWVGGCTALFTHKVDTLKNMERTLIYCGLGCMASGYLKQGLLANRWILNAIAACISRPELVTSFFASTGQEDVGRFCVRLFENNGWRAIYVDDRIPCSNDCAPLFGQSSDPLESWPLILEKAIAKYMGSYGHIGACGLRADASMFALRLLTGGHPIRVPTSNFSWKTIKLDLQGPDGVAYINSMRDEGAIVCLGRSQALALDKRTLRLNPPRVHPPHGYMFPILGEVMQDDWKYFVLRDAFNLVPDCDYTNGVPDNATGHCRIFRVKVDLISQLYDTIFICRFPDLLRKKAEKLRLQPWRTEICSDACHGPSQPARFLLTVLGPPATSAPRKTYMLGGAAEMRAKYVEEKNIKRRLVELQTAKVEKPKTPFDDEVNFSMTFSSSCDWVVANARESRGQMRVRIVPTPETYLALKVRAKAQRKMRREERRVEAARKRRAEELLATLGGTKGEAESEANQEEEEEDTETDESEDEAAQENMRGNDRNNSQLPASSNHTGAAHGGVDNVANGGKPTTGTGNTQGDLMEELHLPRAVFNSEQRKKERRQRKYGDSVRTAFDRTFFSDSSWVSDCVSLYPGEYHIYAESIFKISKEQLAALDKPLDVNEVPWKEGYNLADELRLWAHASSHGQFELRPLRPTEASVGDSGGLTSIYIPPDTWPFLTESQDEIGSKGLMEMLSRLREEAAVLGAKVLTLSRKYKEVYRREEAKWRIQWEKEEEEWRKYNKASRGASRKATPSSNEPSSVSALDFVNSLSEGGGASIESALREASEGDGQSGVLLEMSVLTGEGEEGEGGGEGEGGDENVEGGGLEGAEDDGEKGEGNEEEDGEGEEKEEGEDEDDEGNGEDAKEGDVDANDMHFEKLEEVGVVEGGALDGGKVKNNDDDDEEEEGEEGEDGEEEEDEEGGGEEGGGEEGN